MAELWKGEEIRPEEGRGEERSKEESGARVR